MFGFLKNTFKKKAVVVSNTKETNVADEETDPGKDRIRSRVAQNVKTTQRDKRDKLLNSKRGDVVIPSSKSANDLHDQQHQRGHMTTSASLSTSASQINSTYLVHNEATKTGGTKNTQQHTTDRQASVNKTEMNRRKLLEEWRKKKKEEQARTGPPPVKPVFKVHHVDTKLLGKTSQMPTSSSFNFHVS